MRAEEAGQREGPAKLPVYSGAEPGEAAGGKCAFAYKGCMEEMPRATGEGRGEVGLDLARPFHSFCQAGPEAVWPGEGAGLQLFSRGSTLRPDPVWLAESLPKTS